ncbi:MAG: tripartite-type tricarboxylate transporter receptor subunit TctC, partial [Alphaproteobacteria bacterium]
VVLLSKNRLGNISVSACMITVGLAISSTVEAQDKFPRTVKLIIGTGTGGGFTNYARLTAKHLKKHLPGKPTIVVQNMPGAGGIKSVDWLYHTAPKDGSAIATMPSGALFAKIMGVKRIKHDATRFNYLISVDRLRNMLVVWHTTPYKSINDLFEKQVIIGNSGKPSAMVPAMLNRLIGSKFKVISGYPGTGSIGLAMERGEVDGVINYTWSTITSTKAHWLAKKKIRVLMQVTFKPSNDPRLKGVPTLSKFVKDQESRDILEILLAKQVVGRAFMAPAGVPAGVVNTYRKVLTKIVNDSTYLAEAKKRKLTISVTSGEDIDKFIKRIYATPKATVDKMYAEMKLAEKSFTKRKTNYYTAQAKLVKIKRKGHSIQFMEKGKLVQANSGRSTKITIAGKKAKGQKLKVGMDCAITYEGDRSVAKTIKCN